MISAVCGAVLWLMLLIGTMLLGYDPMRGGLIWIQLAPLVVVPLGLRLLPRPSSGLEERLRHGVERLQFLSALLLMSSFIATIDWMTAGLTLPWLAVTFGMSFLGLFRFLSRQTLDPVDLAFDAGLFYIGIGGAHLILLVLGVEFLGFSFTIIMLTVIHFHYAGFAAMMIVGALGILLRQTSSRMFLCYRWMAWGAIVSIPMLALGIMLQHMIGSPLVEMAAGAFLAASLGGIACLTLFSVRYVKRWAARILLTLSALACLTAMVFAYLYAMRDYLDVGWLTVSRMVEIHGTLNSTGFVLLGLVGWNLERETLR